jgi:hypothetical protein
MTEKNEEKTIEKEIIASYLQGLSTLAIRKEYDISEFELAYILGKHNVPARQCYRKVGDDTTIVYADGGVRIPKNIIATLGLEHGQKIRFVVIDKQHLTLQLQEIK